MTFWNNIARSTVRELAKAAGLRSSNQHAVEDLTETFGPAPDADFVNDYWFVLRDGWLTRSSPHRGVIVERMRTLGRGDMTIKTRTRASQLAYLRSIRRSPALVEVVLDVFLESGSEERPDPVFVETPPSPEEQQDRFYGALAERLRVIGPSTIEAAEKAVHAAVFSAVADLRLPIEDAMDDTGRLVASVASVLLLDEAWEPGSSELLDYQRVLLERAPGRIGDQGSAKELFSRYFAVALPALQDVNASPSSIARWASASFFATLAFDGPDDAPDGFVHEIMSAQQRFLSEPPGPDEDGSTDDPPLELDELLADAMTRVPNSTRPAGLENGAVVWQVFAGSAVVNVFREPFVDEAPPLIRFASPLVRGLVANLDLLQTLNRVTATESLYKLYLEDDTVYLEYGFTVDTFSERLFHWSLARFLGTADHFDSALQDRFGGAMSGQDQRAVFDA